MGSRIEGYMKQTELVFMNMHNRKVTIFDSMVFAILDHSADQRTLNAFKGELGDERVN